MTPSSTGLGIGSLSTNQFTLPVLSSTLVLLLLGLFFSAGTDYPLSFSSLEPHTRGWQPDEIALRSAADAWGLYMRQLQANPVLTKAMTSGFVYALGDVLAQRTEAATRHCQSWDGPRVLRSAVAGFVGHGPLSHCWYNICDFTFEQLWHLSAGWWPLKILLDQTVWGPLWNGTYLVLLGLMRRDPSWTEIWGDVRRSTVPLLLSGLRLWPLAHCVTYGLIPNENRLLWVDLVEVVWVSILATQAAAVADRRGPDAPPAGGAAADAPAVAEGREPAVVSPAP